MFEMFVGSSAAALLAADAGAVHERRLAEVRDLEVLAEWAAVHSADPTRGPEGTLAHAWATRSRTCSTCSTGCL